MKRYTITEGATTTAGGKIIDASSHGCIMGARIALENDPVFCPACNVAGHIVCIGPRQNERWNGKQVALENDLCVCGCYPHPRLVANQNMRCQVVADEAGAPGHAEQTSTDGHADAAAGAATGHRDKYNQHFHVKDEAGHPLPDWPYAIELNDGRRIEGRTNREGKTVEVEAATAEHATLIVYAPETTPLNPTWDR